MDHLGSAITKDAVFPYFPISNPNPILSPNLAGDYGASVYGGLLDTLHGRG